jgi:hypothetical protein
MRQKPVVISEHMCYHKKAGVSRKGQDMRLLRLAVESQRWDLAAHTIVLATARLLSKGDKENAGGSNKKKRRPKGQSERS